MFQEIVTSMPSLGYQHLQSKTKMTDTKFNCTFEIYNILINKCGYKTICLAEKTD